LIWDLNDKKEAAMQRLGTGHWVHDSRNSMCKGPEAEGEGKIRLPYSGYSTKAAWPG